VQLRVKTGRTFGELAERELVVAIVIKDLERAAQTCAIRGQRDA
jgi:hypothetical protein